MKKIKGNILDIHQRKIFFGELFFNEKIEKIELISQEINSKYPYILPGLIDSHVHIESSMLSPVKFSELVSRYGTIVAVCDPHEIVNVCGLDGFDYMYNQAQKSSIYLFFSAPSCVPATGFETNGAVFGLNELLQIKSKVVALAEMMNYPGVISHDESVMKKINKYKESSLPIDGHAPGLRGYDAVSYFTSGISTDHECFDVEEALYKIGLGVKIQIREGSAARNLNSLLPLFEKYSHSVMLCTDDCHPDDVLERGHIDRFYKPVLSVASIFDFFQAAHANPKQHYNLPVGSLCVGDSSDFIVVDNLDTFAVTSTYIKGVDVLAGSRLDIDPASQVTEVNNFVSRFVGDSEFDVKRSLSGTVNVIQVTDGELITSKYLWNPTCALGDSIASSVDDDVMKIAVINRYDASAPVVNGFVKGFGLKNGAMACSIAHDSHNVICVGSDSSSMANAVNAVFENKGGIAVVDGDYMNMLPLPIAGLMSNEDYRYVSDKYISLVSDARQRLGVVLKSPFMTMAFMSLLVIPSIKIGDKGLFDVDTFSFVSLENKEDK